MRQSAAHSRHQLLPVRGVCAACKWCIAASRWCSDVNVSNGAYGPRSPTQTRPFSSVSALVAAAFGPAVGSAACRVRSGDTRAACIRTRAAGAASGCAICSSSPWQSTAWQAQQDFAATADWRVRRGRECGNQQPIHVISSSLYVMYARRLACDEAVSAAISSPLTQQAAGAPMPP